MAGSKSNAFENALLLLLFQNTAIANIGNVAGLQPSGVAGSFYLALFTTAPSDAAPGTEASYTGYARLGVVRSAAGWDVTNNVASNNAALDFNECTAGNETIVGIGLMTALSGGDMLLWSDDPNFAVAAGSIPHINAGDLTFTED